MSRSTPPARDVRLRAIGLTLAATAALGALIAGWPEDGQEASRLGQATTNLGAMSAGKARESSGQSGAEIQHRFDQGVLLLHMRDYRQALTTFHRVLELAPEMPEAHVNAGYALLGLKQWAAARDFFESATALRSEQANAYYGLAVALDELGDRAGALGAMRTFLHRAGLEDPFRRKAEAAVWEWESAKPGPSPERWGTLPVFGKPAPVSRK